MSNWKRPAPKIVEHKPVEETFIAPKIIGRINLPREK